MITKGRLNKLATEFQWPSGASLTFTANADLDQIVWLFISVDLPGPRHAAATELIASKPELVMMTDDVRDQLVELKARQGLAKLCWHVAHELETVESLPDPDAIVDNNP